MKGASDCGHGSNERSGQGGSRMMGGGLSVDALAKQYVGVDDQGRIADPDLRTIGVHRPGLPPISFNETEELVGDPYLPGFRVVVGTLFD